MARRGLTGQLNMFELFGNLEPPGEVQMVSLMPEDEPLEEEKSEIVVEAKPEVKPVIVIEPQTEPELVQEPSVEKVIRQKPVKDSGTVAMSREMLVDGEKIEIAYINYNKVRIVQGQNEPKIYEFTSSKEAVDFYVEKMQDYLPDEE